jgi:hypothetical protein
MTSAREAELAMIGPLLDKIRTLPPTSPCTADRIPPHSAVKIDGEWPTFDGFQESTGLMFLSSGSSGWTHRPAEGELFDWVGQF